MPIKLNCNNYNFEKNYQKVKKLAEYSFHKYNLEEWKFKINKGKVLLGYCNAKNKTISLSKHFLNYNDFFLIKMIFFHELAHAIVGCENGHNKVWQRMSEKLGGSTTRMLRHPNLIMPLHKYTAKCKKCGLEYNKYNKPFKNYVYICKKCNRLIKFIKI